MSLPNARRIFRKIAPILKLERTQKMTKLLATLVASFFAVSTAFAASHAGAPMAAASGAKPAASASAMKEDKAAAKAEKKAAKKSAKKAAAKKADKAASAKS
jgi:hypothetical protein